MGEWATKNVPFIDERVAMVLLSLLSAAKNFPFIDEGVASQRLDGVVEVKFRTSLINPAPPHPLFALRSTSEVFTAAKSVSVGAAPDFTAASATAYDTSTNRRRSNGFGMM